ncbi:MAG: tRNA threonylcarbamoyladenosine dehydratase [Bacteroidota bacterium]
MIDNWQERTNLLLGNESVKKLASAKVLVVGLGGVGAYAAEMICRAGIGHLSIVDGDKIHPTNRNRQLLALKSTESKYKASLMGERLRDINPGMDIVVYDEYIKDDRMKEILVKEKYDYVVDAIDTLSPKVYLLFHSLQQNLKVISSMGSGGKTNPALIQVTDISKTYNCRLAFYIRKNLRKLGIFKGFNVVFSPEDVSKKSVLLIDGEQNKRSTVGTVSYMPAIFGCFCASEVIRSIANS